MNKMNRILLYLYLVFVGIGLQFELVYLSQQDFTVTTGRDLFLNLCLLAAFFVPILLLIRKLAAKLAVSQLLLAMSLIGGAFAAGWISFAGNSMLDIFNAQFITDPEDFQIWTDALTAPFAEEFFKAALAFLVIYILNRKDLKSIFIAGLGTGLGFQMIEDLGYVARETLKADSSGMAEALGRISEGFASHTVYTAVVAVGAFLLLSQASQRKEKLFGLWAVFCTVACHFMRNSPLVETSHRINIVAGIVFAVQIATFIEVYRRVSDKPSLPLDGRLEERAEL